MKTKKITSLLLFLLIIFLYSCNDENLELDTDPSATKTTNIDGISISADGQLLHFKDDNHFKMTMNKFANMNTSEQNIFLSKLNFTSSLQTKLIEAENELDVIAELPDLTSFVNRYNEFKEKYSNNFIFDTATEDVNFSPQLKVENPIFSYFVNEDGEIVVAGQKVNLNKFTHYAETQIKQQELRATTAVEYNFLEMKNSKRKLRTYAEKNSNGQLVIKFTCQAKVWYGWKNNNSEYAVRLVLKNCSPYYYNYPENTPWTILANSSNSYKTTYSTSNWSGTFASIPAGYPLVQPRGYIYVSSSAFDFGWWGKVEIAL